MQSLTMTAKAKINLSLKVLNKRDDGYHNIESVMQSVAFGDEVTVTRKEEPGITVVSSDPALPTDDGNIACRAAALMQTHCRLSGGFEIRLEKKIPVAAGLAGGSTNAAAVMHLINRLCELSLSAEELEALGLTLGADVPFCLYGKPALAEGIGERLTPVAGLADCYIVLANPGIGVSTGMIYQALNGGNPQAGGNTKALLGYLSNGNLHKAFGEMNNVMEPVAMQFCPQIGVLLEKLRAAGADHAMMSGSGATCFGVFCKQPEEEKLKAMLGKDFVALTTPMN